MNDGAGCHVILQRAAGRRHISSAHWRVALSPYEAGLPALSMSWELRRRRVGSGTGSSWWGPDSQETRLATSRFGGACATRPAAAAASSELEAGLGASWIPDLVVARWPVCSEVPAAAELGEMSDLGDWFRSIPFITRYWFASSIAVPLIGKLGLISPAYLFLWPDAFIYRFQVGVDSKSRHAERLQSSKVARHGAALRLPGIVGGRLWGARCMLGGAVGWGCGCWDV